MCEGVAREGGWHVSTVVNDVPMQYVWPYVLTIMDNRISYHNYNIYRTESRFAEGGTSLVGYLDGYDITVRQ